jgi:hypothetical protein
MYRYIEERETVLSDVHQGDDSMSVPQQSEVCELDAIT